MADRDETKGRDETTDRDEQYETQRGETFSKREDDRARDASEHPLHAAATPQGKPRRSRPIGWAVPAGVVAIAVVILFIYVAFW